MLLFVKTSVRPSRIAFVLTNKHFFTLNKTRSLGNFFLNSITWGKLHSLKDN